MLVWEEEGRPPVQPPTTAGFGTAMLGKSIEYPHQGRNELIWRDAALGYRLSLPLADIATASGKT